MNASLNHGVECGISSGYKFDDKKPDSPTLRIQFAHFPFKLPDHDEQQNGVPRWPQVHQWMTITKKKKKTCSSILTCIYELLPQYVQHFVGLETVLAKSTFVMWMHVWWLEFSWPFVMILQVMRCQIFDKV